MVVSNKSCSDILIGQPLSLRTFDNIEANLSFCFCNRLTHGAVETKITLTTPVYRARAVRDCAGEFDG
jgi:hypothetical protein